VRRALRGDRGDVIAFAILWPLIMIIIFAGIQVAFIYQAADEARAAAQQAATAEAAYGAIPGIGYGVATQFLTPAGDLIHDQHIDIVRRATDVQVTVTGEVVGWLGVRYHVHGTADVPIEQFVS
jgi:hypothetical protein